MSWHFPCPGAQVVANSKSLKGRSYSARQREKNLKVSGDRVEGRWKEGGVNGS